MKRLFFLLLSLVYVTPCDATGLINRLPSDGTWTRYQMRLEKEIHGLVMNFTGDLIVSSVGREQQGEVKRRWLEFKMVKKSRKRETILIKALVPEESLKRGLSTWDHSVTGWVKENKGDPYPLDPNRLLPVLRFYLNGDNPNEIKTSMTNAGNLGTEHVTGTLTYRTTFEHKKKPTTVDIKIDYECWLDNTSPFGTSKSLFTLIVHDTKGRLKERVKTTLSLKDQGTEAVSSLPNHH